MCKMHKKTHTDQSFFPVDAVANTKISVAKCAEKTELNRVSDPSDFRGPQIRVEAPMSAAENCKSDCLGKGLVSRPP